MTSVCEEPAQSPRITVVQALPKGDRGELAVETMTEAGVDAVVPWAASRCVTQWRGGGGGQAPAEGGGPPPGGGQAARRGGLSPGGGGVESPAGARPAR